MHLHSFLWIKDGIKEVQDKFMNKKILLIDNGSTLLLKLRTLIPGCEVVRRWNENFDDYKDFDFIVLSGSSEFSVLDNIHALKNEISLIQRAEVPLIGVCFGHELIAYAFGSEIQALAVGHKGIVDVMVTVQHEIFGGRTSFEVFENHTYSVTRASNDFEILARTDDCVSIIEHRNKKIIGFQFHPENHTDELIADDIFINTIKYLSNK